MNKLESRSSESRARGILRELSLIIRQPKVRLPLLLLLHSGLFTLIFVFSYAARYDFQMPDKAVALLLATLGPVVLTKVGVFYFGRHFHGWWRYVTFADLRSLMGVSLLAMFTIVFLDYYLLPYDSPIPRLVILLDTLLTIMVVGGLRCSWRFFDEQLGPVFQRKNFRPAVMVGSDPVVGQLVCQINSNPAVDVRVRAIASNEPAWHRAVIGGVPVAGLTSEIVAIAQKCQAKDILVPAGLITGRELRTLVNLCNGANLQLRVLPNMADAMLGNASIPLRPLEINDLLRREPVALDTERLVSLVKNKRVLVTGAGGSIGSEICRQLINFSPSELILLGRGENRIHQIHLELKEPAREAEVQLTQVIGSITDEAAMRTVFAKRQPEIVFHAAAHKHVPLMEMHIGEAVKNNVYGTQVLASLADEFGVGHFVLVSSDKAVNPTSVMGCTKHLAERVVHEHALDSETKFVVVRFGNVLGSAGSVIPVFQKQIAHGGPITITDKQMTRYFMSIPEAAQLVMQSAAMSKGGEIFVLDMGQPISIVQLAEDLVSLSGLAPGSIEFEYVGIRPGEKLHEELYFNDETTIPTEHAKVRAAYHRDGTGIRVIDRLPHLMKLVNAEPKALREALIELVPSYRTETPVRQIALSDSGLHPVAPAILS